MLRMIWTLTGSIYFLLRGWLPSNLVIAAIRTRRGLKWGLPAMLLAIPCLLAGAALTVVIDDGGPGWLHLVVLILIVDAIKFVAIGPVSVALLVRARIREHRISRRGVPTPRYPATSARLAPATYGGSHAAQ